MKNAWAPTADEDFKAGPAEDAAAAATGGAAAAGGRKVGVTGQGGVVGGEAKVGPCKAVDMSSRSHERLSPPTASPPSRTPTCTRSFRRHPRPVVQV